MANTITVAAPPTTPQVAQELLAAQTSQTGVITDLNVGSQIRTLSEAIGAVEEISGISNVAVALQLIAYAGMTLFGISPSGAVGASGAITFATAILNPPPAQSNVVIPSGTLMQSLGGVQFQTTVGVTLLAGVSGITVPIAAVNGGFNTNVPPGAITQLLSSLLYPLTIYNLGPTAGGVDAESPTQALTRLAAKFISLVGGSPTSVANAAIGVTASGTGEKVVYSTCYEGWADINSPNFPNTPGFVCFIDNGSGAASSALIAAVDQKLNGNINTSTPGYHPSGMPYGVSGVVTIGANVSVSGQLGPLSNQQQLTNSIATAISGYFTLPFDTPAEQGTIAAQVANAALGQLTSLVVQLSYATDPLTAVPLVSGAPYTRVLLNAVSLNLVPLIA